MHYYRSKKILIYFFLFLFIGTLNNKNFKNLNLYKLEKITIAGLDETNNNDLKDRLELFKFKNLFFINELSIKRIINSNNLVENFSVFKEYPSSLNIKIDKTKFIAKVKKDNNNFLLGTNGKLVKAIEIKNDLPVIFGNFGNKSLFDLKKKIDASNFNYYQIKNLFFFQSGRWDIEMISGLVIKLPKENIEFSLELASKLLEKSHEKTINKIDLRQNKQIVIDGR